jgi:hypothetical protein
MCSLAALLNAPHTATDMVIDVHAGAATAATTVATATATAAATTTAAARTFHAHRALMCARAEFFDRMVHR